MLKSLTPQAKISLKEALAVIYWKKNDLRMFVENSFTNIEKGKRFCATINFENTKYQIANEIVSRMCQNPSLFDKDLINLCYNVCNMSDFNHLLIWEDGQEKVKVAREKVSALQRQCKGYFDQEDEQQKSEKRKIKFQENLTKIKENQKIKEDLKTKFNEIFNKSGQERGFAFEKFLNELFIFYDLSPRGAFKVNGEQIDGAFSHNNRDYLLEAKWQKRQICMSDLYAFRGKIDSKLKSTLGLYVSFNGYSQEVLDTYIAKEIILIDGQDLYQILEDRISLPDMIEIKRKEAATTGKAMFRIIC